LAWGTFTDNTSLSFGTDGNLFSEGSLNPYEMTEAGNRRTEEGLRRIQKEQANAGAKEWAGLFEFLNKIFSTMAGAMGSPSIGGTATTAPAPAAA
jgi:hypothetical protein